MNKLILLMVLTFISMTSLAATRYKIISTKDVSTNDLQSISNRVLRVGDIMSGPLTNNVGYYGNGAGLTNLPVTNYNDAAILAATQTLNTAVGNLNNATNALNTSVTNLNNATNALNTVANAALPKAGGIMTGPLTNNAGYYGNGLGLTNLAAPTATNSDSLGNIPAATWSAATNNLQQTKLDKSTTNALAVTALQITGGSPTNGAVWLCTNSVTGGGKWSLPVAFMATLTGDKPHGTTVTKIAWNNIAFNYGNGFDGTNFIAPVNGIYRFIANGGWTRVTGTSARSNPRFYTNSVLSLIDYSWYNTDLGQFNLDSGEIYMTNGGSIYFAITADPGGATNKLDTGYDPMNYFSGSLIREIP